MIFSKFDRIIMNSPPDATLSSMKTIPTDTVLSAQDQSCSVINIASDQLVLNIADASYVPSASVFEVVQYWPSIPTSSTLQDLVPVTVDNKEENGTEHRKRNQKRPFSPDVDLKKKPGEKRKQKVTKKVASKVNSGHVDGCTDGSSFSCAKCQSPYVVNPSRRRGQAKDQTCVVPRRVFDPEANKVLLLCNSCGLALMRTKNKIQSKIPPSQERNSEEEKVEYLAAASQFATLLAEKLQDMDACRLYCPAFKTRSCGCLQDFIKGIDEHSEEAHQRALYMLNLMKEARKLASERNRKTAFSETSVKTGSTKGQTLKLRRSAKYENFVLTNRRYLREQLKICEKACQVILNYSNNFLHKKLKTLPGKKSRVVKTLGRRRQGNLVPIPQLATEHCCADKCVLMALTHSRLLETWRSSVELGQHAARRVLAEMLTPSGGAKSNCYKFISMVTGCSLTTICSVADQMRRTQGEREPLEHGLKKWWREHPRQVNKSSLTTGNSEDEDDDQLVSALDIHIPSAEELRLLEPEEASRQLREQRDKLAQLQEKVLSARGGGPKQPPRQSARKAPPPQQPAAGVGTTELQQPLVRVVDIPHSGSGAVDSTTSVGITLPPASTPGSNIIIVQDSDEGIPVRYSANSKPGGSVEIMKTSVASSLPSVIMVQSTSVNSSDGYQVFNVVDSSEFVQFDGECGNHHNVFYG